MIRYLALGLILSCAMVATQIYFKDEIENLTISDSANLLFIETGEEIGEGATTPSTIDGIPTPLDTRSETKSIKGALSSVATAVATSATPPVTARYEEHRSTTNRTNSRLPGSDELWLSDLDDRPVPERYQRNGLIPEPLKFNQQRVQALSIGDEVSLSIPQTGQAYDLKIQQVTNQENGTRTLTAEITNTPETYSVVVTGGQVSTFATINTPEGTFSLDATGDEAWLVAQVDLDQLIDPNLPDYQIPNMHR